MDLNDPPVAVTTELLTPQELRRYRELVADGLDQAVSDLEQLVAIPSISAAAYDASTVEASAAAVAALLKDLGLFEEVGIFHAEDSAGRVVGRPNVIARRPARAGFPTVVLYAHHDVQPTGDEARWTGKPFELRPDGGRLYGRGASDDKAGVVAHLGALRTLLAAGTDLGIGITAFIEGEEEIGSPTFGQFLDQYCDRLAGDAVVVADASNLSDVIPGLTVSLRGIVVLDVTVATLRTLVHSGGFGGIVPDAMMAASIVIASMYNPDGSVAVAGLTHSAPLTDFARDETEARRQSTVLDGVQSIGRGSTTERGAFGPAITVTGIDAPSTAHASNVLLPSVTFRIAARVAPGQTSAEAAGALERHIAAHAPFGARVSCQAVQGGEPYAVKPDGWATRLMTDALTIGWGAEPALLAQGGSIPFVPVLSAAYPETEILMIGVGDDSSRAHGIDESLSLSVLQKAITTETVFLAAVNTLGAGAS